MIIFNNWNEWFKKIFLFLALSQFLFSFRSYAITEVTSATGGTNLCLGGGYVTLGDIKVQEGAFSDFSTSGSPISYIISVPANFEFEPGKGSVSIIGTKISNISLTVTATTITVTYNQTSTNGNPRDGFNISGIRVKALNTASTGQIRRTGGTAVHAGNPAVSPGQLNHGNLTSYNYPLPVANAGTDRSIVVGNSTVLGGSPTASGSLAPYSYSWTPTTGLNDASLANPTATPSVTTTYILTLVDGNGCTDIDDVTVTVDPTLPPGPAVTTSGTTEFCQGESVVLTSSQNSGNQWYKNGTLIPGETSRYLMANSPGLYQVTYFNGSVTSAMSTAVEVEVYDLPSNKIIAAQHNNLCKDGSTQIEVQASQSGISYQLRNGITNIGSPVIGNGSSIYLPSGSLSSGSYTFNVTATHPVYLCVSVMSNTVNVTVEPEVAAPTLSVSPSSVLCEGEGNITLTATPGYDVYQWFKNNVYLSTSAANTLALNMASESGTYRVKGVFNSPVQCESVLSTSVNINITPLPLQKSIFPVSSQICEGASATIIIPNSEVGVLYQLRNDADNSLLGEEKGGTGSNLSLPTGAINSVTTFNVVAINGISGCTTEMNNLITININPDIVITASTDTDEVCLDGMQTIILKAAASGGQGNLSYLWTGPDGYTSGLQEPLPFLPLNFGNLSYQVEVEDSAGCKAVSTIIVKVNPIPNVYIANNSEDNIICDGKNVRFIAFGAQYYEFLINGDIVQAYSTSSTFTSSSLEDGQVVSVRGFNSNGCYSESSPVTMLVNENPSVTFTGLNNDYCLNDQLIPLMGSPSGGTFSGNGIRGNEFIPEFAGIGTHIISYSYTNVNTGCESTFSRAVEIKNAPSANFTATNVCNGNPMEFLDQSAPSASITSWEWSFGDNSPSQYIQNPSHIYAASGNYLVTLKITSNTGCENTITKEVMVGGIIDSDFNFYQVCEGATTKFTDNSGSGVISYSWNFGDPLSGTSNTSSLKNPEHVFTGIGAYEVRLTVTTSLCTSSVTKIVNILPSIGAAGFPYIQDFEVGTGGWVAGGKNSSWKHGTPSGAIINSAGGGNNSWSTQANNNSYNHDEQSFVNSPCFDFTGLQRPMISLKFWSHTDKAKDGAVIQYSLDNGMTWSRLGNIGEGIEWYNQGSIISQPGGFSIGQEGWSGKETGWKTASFNLDLLLNEPSVRFRIAFGSVLNNPNKAQHNGFAFDDVWIGERSRLVVLEHFTNASKVENDDADFYVNNLTENFPQDIISIHYHTDRPVSTPLNQDNTADPSARSQYYGISQTPRAVLDGNFFNGKSTDWNQINLKHRSLVNPFFDIDIALPAVSHDELEVQVTVTSRFVYNDPVVVHIAVVEEVLILNGKPYKNVLKKLLPDGAGTSIMEQWQTGTQKFINGYWNINRLYGEDKELKVIVYVQNINTKEILQANYKMTAPKKNLVTTGIEPGLPEVPKSSKELVIYPVPGNHYIYCQFEEPVAREHQFTLVDQRGVVISNGSIKIGASELILDVSEVADGMYFLNINSAENQNFYRKILVRH